MTKGEEAGQFYLLDVDTLCIPSNGKRNCHHFAVPQATSEHEIFSDIDKVQLAANDEDLSTHFEPDWEFDTQAREGRRAKGRGVGRGGIIR